MKCAISITIFAFLLAVNYCVALPHLMKIQVCPDDKEFKVCGDMCAETCESYRLKQNISGGSTVPGQATTPSGVSLPSVTGAANGIGSAINGAVGTVVNSVSNNSTDGSGLLCKICKPGCACKGDTVEDKTSKMCVAREQCPPL